MIRIKTSTMRKDKNINWIGFYIEDEFKAPMVGDFRSDFLKNLLNDPFVDPLVS